MDERAALQRAARWLLRYEADGCNDAAGLLLAADVCNGLAAVIGACMGLLGDLGGADLAGREVRRIWPQVPRELLRPAEAPRA